MGKLRTLLEFVKIEHTLFALPFVLAGMLLGFRSTGAPFDGRTFAFVLAAATGARTLGMTLNRIVDKPIDARNPRTAARALPAGTMSMRAALALALVAGTVLVVSAWRLNTTVLLLSPVLVLLFFAYPYAKRVTWACHFVLGLAFLCAPMGGYLAVTGSFAGWPAPMLLCVAAMAWVAGFDIIYALLDVDFDRANGVHSVPADFGDAPARRVAAALHVLVVLCLAAFARVAGFGWPMYAATAAVAALLAYEHATVDPRDPVAINKAFFHVNAVVGWIALAGLVGATLV
ncbi:MAG TPA: 4-hydroxybenzoate octaprenyltransferase [Candidatus Thermoplasmatota archaeon]|nr:4-hydroxybenzoate octaprenyltransferase [Candidatus Thermoplasmatota archaeon]